MFGGQSDPAIARTAKYGIGHTQGGGTPESLEALMGRVNNAWKAAGRQGKPQFRALAYFALGDEVHEEAESNLVSYYADFGSRVWQGTIKSAAEAKERVDAYQKVGADELILFMTAPSVDQVERLAAAVL